MANAFLTITRDDIRPAFARLTALGKDTTPVMRAMGTTFKSITEGNFNSAGAQYRPTPWPAKKDGSPSNLKRSGLLWHAFHLTVTKDLATLTNPTPYAAIHQFGARGHVAGQKVGVVKTKYANGRYVGSYQDVMSGSKGIPPRPFYPVINGKLTPAAEEKVAAAGMRVAERIALGK